MDPRLQRDWGPVLHPVKKAALSASPMPRQLGLWMQKGELRDGQTSALLLRSGEALASRMPNEPLDSTSEISGRRVSERDSAHFTYGLVHRSNHSITRPRR